MPAQNVSFISASGARNKSISKQVLLDVKFDDDISLPIVFLIVKKLNVNILIGCDALKQYKMKLDFENEMVKIRESNIKFCKKSTVRYQNIFNIKVDHELNNDELWEKQINNIYEFLKDDDPRMVNKLVDLYEAYRDVFSDKPGLARGYMCKLNMKENVKINRKSYPVPQGKVEAVKAELNKMLKDGIIELGESEFCNPMVVVEKSNGEIRLCIDPRQLNNYIVKEQTNPECTDSILLKFNKCNYMSSFDLTSGVFQVPLHSDSQKYVAFCLFGRVYHFLRLPFGLCVSSSEFIRCLYQVLGENVLSYSIVYVDDMALC